MATGDTRVRFVDDDGTPVLIWRPTSAPPLPRSGVTHADAVPDKYVTRSAEARTPDRLGEEVPQQRRREYSPPSIPLGQLLPRGADGIDGVLQKARESQRMFWSLQERRLKRERREAQRRLRNDLDCQRDQRRMLRLAQYQEELVNIYGPTVKNIISDTFFDDGMDPALQVLAQQAAEPSTVILKKEKNANEADRRMQVLAAWQVARQEHQRAGGVDSASIEQELAMLALPMQCSDVPDTASLRSRQKELLNRALDYHRGGRAMPF